LKDTEKCVFVLYFSATRWSNDKTHTCRETLAVRSYGELCHPTPLSYMMGASLQFVSIIHYMMSNATHKTAYRHEDNLPCFSTAERPAKQMLTFTNTNSHSSSSQHKHLISDKLSFCFLFASNLAWHPCLHLFLKIKQQKAEQPPYFATGAQCAVR